MINTGYIRIFRAIMDKGWYKDSECVALWLHLLLKANHKGAEFMHGFSIVKLKPGQFVTGRKALSLETGISESKIERILKLFENEKQIEQQTNSRNRVITILSWDKYQKGEQQTNSRRTASEQQVNTNNNDNNDNNDKNDIYKAKREFYEKEILDNSEKEQIEGYKNMVKYIFGENPIKVPLDRILKAKHQLRYESFEELIQIQSKSTKKLRDILLEINGYEKTQYTILFSALKKWFNG